MHASGRTGFDACAEMLSVASADSRSRLWSGEILRLKREIAQDVRDLIALRAAARATARGRKRRGDGTWEPGDPRNPTLRHPTRPI